MWGGLGPGGSWGGWGLRVTFGTSNEGGHRTLAWQDKMAPRNPNSLSVGCLTLAQRHHITQTPETSQSTRTRYPHKTPTGTLSEPENHTTCLRAQFVHTIRHHGIGTGSSTHKQPPTHQHQPHWQEIKAAYSCLHWLKDGKTAPETSQYNQTRHPNTTPRLSEPENHTTRL